MLSHLCPVEENWVTERLNCAQCLDLNSAQSVFNINILLHHCDLIPSVQNKLSSAFKYRVPKCIPSILSLGEGAASYSSLICGAESNTFWLPIEGEGVAPALDSKHLRLLSNSMSLEIYLSLPVSPYMKGNNRNTYLIGLLKINWKFFINVQYA